MNYYNYSGEKWSSKNENDLFQEHNEPKIPAVYLIGRQQAQLKIYAKNCWNFMLKRK